MPPHFTRRHVPLAACRLSAVAELQVGAPRNAKPDRLADADAGDTATPKLRSRRWSMVATTGKVVERWWGALVLDLDGATFRQRLALLLDHDTDQRLGFSERVQRTDRGLEASGKFLSTPLADRVLEEARDGFPWQASLMAVPSRVQVLDEGETATVNGRQVQGPVHIFREWSLRELTVTVLGADDDTSTAEGMAAGDHVDVAFSRAAKPTSAPAPAPAKARTVPTSSPAATLATPQRRIVPAAAPPRPQPPAPPAPSERDRTLARLRLFLDEVLASREAVS